MRNMNFESPTPEKNIPFEGVEKIELSGPSLRIFNATKKELGMLFGFGLKDIDSDLELMAEINRHFLGNEGRMGNKVLEWKSALSDINKDAEEVEKLMAKNFAKDIYEFITTESKIKNRFNN